MRKLRHREVKQLSQGHIANTQGTVRIQNQTV